MKYGFVLILLACVFTFASDHHSDSVPAEKALGWLKNGNARFTSGNFRKDGKKKADLEKLATGQHPHSIVLSCADSRVPTEEVFDQVPGEIFTVRVAGQALDSSVIASIEYAVEHLGSKLIVVMGHTSCGAVKAALGAKKGESVGSPDLDKLVADIKPRIERVPSSATSDLKEHVNVNAKGVAHDLVERSKIIAEKVKAGELEIRSAVYNLPTGKVEFN